MSSVDTQSVLISKMMKNKYFTLVVRSQMDHTYFKSPIIRIIYKSIVHSMDESNKLPSLDEIIVYGESQCEKSDVDFEDYRDRAESLYNQESDIEEDTLFDIASKFIRKVRIDRLLASASTKDTFDSEQFAEELIKGWSVNMGRADVFSLSNTKVLEEAKKEVEDKQVIKSSIDSINMCSQYRGYIRGTLNMVVGAPGKGKTTFLINEGAYAAKQGAEVLHVFIGDMTRMDSFVRYLSCITGCTQDDITRMDSSELISFVNVTNSSNQNVLNRIDCLVYGAGELNMDQLISNIERIQTMKDKHYGVIIVDYADNLIKESDMMYESGGIMYNKLSLMARVNKSAVFVASQPSREYWRYEVIPLEGAAESSKKQHIADLMLTLGTPCKDARIASMFVAKMRRGKSYETIRLRLDFDTCRIIQISEAEYQAERETLNLDDFEFEEDRKRKGKKRRVYDF